MTQEALKLALEALEYHTAQTRPIHQTDEAITAIKQALAQPEQCQCPNCKVTLHASDCAVHSGPAYPAGKCDCGAQTQEPVAWIHNFIEGGISIGKRPADLNRHPDRWTALYKDPTPCQTQGEKHLTQDFLEKIVDAVWESQKGSPIKDFLSDDEITQALSMLADILVATGVQLKENNHG